MRPILKWAGGKARLAPEISAAFAGPCTGTYYEPFVGGGAVFLYRRARGLVENAVIADLNQKLISVHLALRDDLDGLMRALDRLPKEDWRERYYDVRERYNEGPWVGTEHAARFIWLNRTGFNGLYRENLRGEYNVPIGKYKEVRLPPVAHFRAVSELLQGVDIRVADFRQVLSEVGEGDQVYCDPPYVPISDTASFTKYTKEGFGFEEQLALADFSRDAARRGACVVLSNHDLPVVRRELYPLSFGFRHVSETRVTRAISRSGASRRGVKEIVAAIGPFSEAA